MAKLSAQTSSHRATGEDTFPPPRTTPTQPTCEEAHGQLRNDQVLEWDVGLAVPRPPVKGRRQEVKGATEHAALLRRAVVVVVGGCGPRGVVPHVEVGRGIVGRGGMEHKRRLFINIDLNSTTQTDPQRFSLWS